MKNILSFLTLACAIVVGAPGGVRAQTVSYSENFTGATTNNSWYYFNGACLTAGSTTATVNNVPGSSSAVAGQIPSCASMTTGTFYYNVGNAIGEPLVGGTNGSIPGTDGTAGGALRFTNVPTNPKYGYPEGFFESGAILSNFSFPLSSQGIEVTFVTESYEGDGGGGDGADGMSFFLQDASYPPDLGATGGSLAYSCSNVNNDNTHFRDSGRARGYDGLSGGYVGVGIDEYGNFLNGSNSTNGNAPTATNDNTASGASNVNGGANFQGNRIGIRGAGNISWQSLSTNTATSAYYPSSFSNAQASAAVQATCQTGYAQQYNATTGTFSPVKPLISVADYPALAYANVPSVKIANESAIYRGNGTKSQLGSNYGVPISYKLKITTAGLLTLSYSYDGGASQSVISGYNIVTNNGALPANVRFGFAGSDGGATNIHEVMCFQAAPQTTAQSSATGNQKQSAPVVTGTQVYFSYYDPNTWAGSVASDSLLVDSSGNVYVNSTANWDASCVLTGVASAATCAKTGATGPVAAESPTSRVALTWSPATSTTAGTGIPFAWASLTTAEQAALDTGDLVSGTQYRLNYLLGDRTNEQNSSGTGAYSGNTPSYPPYRARVSVLGDIVDSSPTWVGPPEASFTDTWTDKYHGGTMPENASSAQVYSSYVTQEKSRINVVYAGANDGFLHGFRSGYFDANGNYVGTGTGSSFVGTDNDGYEVLAYMPYYVLNNIQTAATTTTTTTTTNGTTVTTTGPTSVTVANAHTNYSDPQYAHQFDVDATPGTGDVYYGGAWHTLLVGGLGAGGADIFALDVTNPANSSITADPTFSTGNASSIVIGDWSTSTTSTTTVTSTCTIKNNIPYCTNVTTPTTTTTSTLSCTHTTATANTAANCGLNLGNTYGTPVIRRFHNGQWGAVFGNGFGSPSGDAGIYVMLLNGTTGAPTFYYLSAGQAGKSDGIAYTTPADLDGDHIADYVYAGDLLGNVWRFDLTSTDPTAWAVTSPAVYTTATGQPITTKVTVVSVLSQPARRILIAFGTGQQVPLTATSPTSYQESQQALYGIWDWNLTTWNSNSTTQYAALPYTVGTTTYAAPTSALSAGSLTPSNLSAQSMTTVTIAGSDYRTVTNNVVCWPGVTISGCSSSEYGWYLPLTYGYANPNDVNLPTATGTTPVVYEQAIYNPILVGDTFVINTTIPSATSLINCFSANAGGFTMAIDPGSGGSFKKTVFVPPSTSTGNYNGYGASGTGTGFSVTNFSSGSSGGTSASMTPACTGSNCSSSGSGGSGGSGSGGGPPPAPCTPGTSNYIITQTVSGTPTSIKFNPQCNTTGTRQTWIQRR